MAGIRGDSGAHACCFFIHTLTERKAAFSMIAAAADSTMYYYIGIMRSSLVDIGILASRSIYSTIVRGQQYEVERVACWHQPAGCMAGRRIYAASEAS